MTKHKISIAARTVLIGNMVDITCVSEEGDDRTCNACEEHGRGRESSAEVAVDFTHLQVQQCLYEIGWLTLAKMLKRMLSSWTYCASLLNRYINKKYKKTLTYLKGMNPEPCIYFFLRIFT